MADHLPVRRAIDADVDAVRDLTRAAYTKWVPTIGREPKPMTADYAAAVRNHRIDLVHRDGRLVALIQMIDDVDHLLIENIAVAPAYQGCGLGKKLLAHAERIARSWGYATVRLYTNKIFAENIQLYLTQGYTIDSEETLTGGIVVHMSKQISKTLLHEDAVRSGFV
jgi:GNAT superfamily N-acetyltransferase